MTSSMQTEVESFLKSGSRNAVLSDVRTRQLSIPATDGYALAATVFEHVDRGRDVPLVIVNPATSVPRRFYDRFAAALAARGFDVITYDYRGIGGSRPRSLRGFRVRMADWGTKDFEGVLRYARDVLGRTRVRVVGHSVGGQVLGFAESNEMVERAVCIASQLGDYRLWPRAKRPPILLAWYGVVPLTSVLFGYVPGRLGIGEDLPAGIARQWRDWSMTDGYFFGGPEGDALREGYARLRTDVLAVSVQADPFAPCAAVDAWVRAFPHARLTREHIEDSSLGHFGFFRAASARRWERVAEFLA